MRRTLDRLEPVAGRPLVVLEPSCAATLRTDLPELLPGDARARAVAASVRTFAQTLEELAPDWEPPRLDRPVAGQTHCHQHAVLGDAAERRLRERAGLAGDLSGGCCGLAGNFGFERGHYDVSVACAQDRLLPAVSAAPPAPRCWRTASPAARSWRSSRTGAPATSRSCWRRRCRPGRTVPAPETGNGCHSHGGVSLLT